MLHSRFPRVASLLALSLALVSAPAAAQSEARAYPVTGCNNPSPPESLILRATDPGQVKLPNADGVYVTEIESIGATGSWGFLNDRPGFSGSGFYRWNGPNLFSSPGQGVLTYRIWVEQAGTYQVRIHNRHDNSDSSEENDCWMRVNGGGWTKTYSNQNNNSFVWNWHFRFDPGHGAVQYRFDAGLNTIQISGRSHGFMIDRLTVFPWGAPGGEDVNTPVTRTMGFRPVIGTTFTLHAGDPTDAAGLDPNNTMALLLTSLERSRCGIPVPGLGISGGNGDLLLDGELLQMAPARRWRGPANPAIFDLPVPNDPALVGASAVTQAVLYETTSGGRGVLTNGVMFTVGTH